MAPVVVVYPAAHVGAAMPTGSQIIKRWALSGPPRARTCHSGRADQPVTCAVMSIVKRAVGRLVHRGWAYAREAAALSPGSTGAYRFRGLGEGACVAFPLGAIFGEAWIEIGAHTLIGERVSISAGMGPGVDLGPDTIVRIGGGCSIGRGRPHGGPPAARNRGAG